MTELYHYSGVGFKKAILNLGVFRNEDSKLVGVLQWGCSYQEKIRLDRYVKEDISKNEYLEYTHNPTVRSDKISYWYSEFMNK